MGDKDRQGASALNVAASIAQTAWLLPYHCRNFALPAIANPVLPSSLPWLLHNVTFSVPTSFFIRFYGFTVSTSFRLCAAFIVKRILIMASM